MKRVTVIVLITLAFITNAFYSHAADTTRFTTCELIIDSGSSELAAWQIELTYDKSQVAIVGLEGGRTKAFPSNRPPFYDRKGLKAGRIILANLCTDKSKLATGKQVVAIIHLQVKGTNPPKLTSKIMAAANAHGNKIKITCKIVGVKK